MPVNPTFAQGVDLSKWNVSYDPYKKPMDFAIIKASEGTTRDPKFVQLLGQCAPVPVRGAYHYYRSQVPWEVQAVNFLRAVEEAEAANGVDIHMLALDYEHGSNVLDARTDGELLRMAEWVRGNQGRRVLLYSQYDMLVKEMPKRKAQWHYGWPWWVARWWSVNHYESTPNITPGCEHAIWQYGGDFRHPTEGWFVPGYKQGAEYGVRNDSIDRNAYNGTLAQMKAWLGLPAEPPKEAPNPSTQPQRGKPFLTRLLTPKPR